MIIDPSIPIQTETLYMLSNICWRSSDWKQALDVICNEIRPYFVFDNLVVYLYDETELSLEVAYARATGRGKYKEADVSWGESALNEFIKTNRTLLKEPAIDEPDRFKKPHILVVPLQSNNAKFGAVAFIRFETPQFTQDHINFAEFMSSQISAMILRQDYESMISQFRKQVETLQIQEDFISTLSHEVNTPIGFIKGYTTTLLRSDIDWDTQDQEEFLRIIDQETDRLKDLIDNLLDSSRLHSGTVRLNMQAVRIEAILQDVVSYANVHYPDLEINLDIRQDLPVLQGDPKRLKQVFDNLVSNVVKYAPEKPLHIRVYREENGVTIDFKDGGKGIPPRDLERIFDRFYRSESLPTTSHGSGLGLYICKKIIEAHNGTISVSSIVNIGTTMHVFLPWKD
jgi:signal transduction histidine kinase